MFSKYSILGVFALSVISLSSFAQGDIGNEEITITKDREIKLSKANRIFDKIPVIETEKASKKITYVFYDRKPTGIQEVNFQPNIIDPMLGVKAAEVAGGYANYLKLGGGNFGRILGELHYNSDQASTVVYGIHAAHNSVKRGPIDGANSAFSTNYVQGDGKYNANAFTLKGKAGYERRVYHFYGYDTSRYNFNANELRQRLNLVNAGLSIENTRPEARFDYKIQTDFLTLKDALTAEEIDWGTKLQFYFPLIKDRLVTSLKSDAYLTQRIDNMLDGRGVNKRNLFRVEPNFQFNYNQFGLRVGYRAVNQYDQINGINATKGFPTAEFTYKTPKLYYFSVGIDGDLVRNTLRSFLDENPFLRNQVALQNSEKSREYYVASKGDITGALSYQARVSYGQYRNLYFYTIYPQYFQPGVATRQYDATYEPDKTNFSQVNIQVNYQPSQAIRSSINGSYNYFQTKKLEKPFHRPSIDIKWTNSFVIAEQFVASADMYVLGGMYSADPFSGGVSTKLPTIIDLNTQFNYLIGKQLTAFVRLNNILGKNYQRFQYYPQQGLNFLVGMDVSL